MLKTDTFEVAMEVLDTESGKNKYMETFRDDLEQQILEKNSYIKWLSDKSLHFFI